MYVEKNKIIVEEFSEKPRILFKFTKKSFDSITSAKSEKDFFSDILDELKIDIRLKKSVELTDAEQKVIHIIDGITYIDEIAYQLNCPVYELMPILLNLEIKQMIKQSPAKYFSRLA